MKVIGKDVDKYHNDYSFNVGILSGAKAIYLGQIRCRVRKKLSSSPFLKCKLGFVEISNSLFCH
jgi:hypothetical protein